MEKAIAAGSYGTMPKKLEHERHRDQRGEKIKRQPIHGDGVEKIVEISRHGAE